MKLTNKEIKDLDRIKRLNIINSITGIKPGNLIGSKGANGSSNLAVFSSVVHLSSNPPLVGFFLRPDKEVRRHTFENIIHSKVYTINHVPSPMTKNAHYTSAKFDASISEFDTCGFSEQYINDFNAPFVMESKLKLGLEYREHVPIELNNTVLVIGEVVYIECDDLAVNDQGYIDLEKLDSCGIGGLNTYYRLKKIGSYPYARVEELPKFTNEGS